MDLDEAFSTVFSDQDKELILLARGWTKYPCVGGSGEYCWEPPTDPDEFMATL